MTILNNIAGALGFSQGNMIRNAMNFVGLPEGLSSAVGLVMDVKNGNIASALFKTGPALLQALTGGQAGQANSVDRPSSVFGTLLKVAGFATVGILGAKLLGGGASVAGLATAGLGTLTGSGLGLAAALGFGAVALGGGRLGFDQVMGFQSSTLRQFTGQTRTNQGIGSDSLVAKLQPPVMFEDLVAAFMVDFVKDKQKEIEGKLDRLRKTAANAEGSGVEGSTRGFMDGFGRNLPLVGRFIGGAKDNEKSGTSESRNIEFEMLKNEMQKLSQMQQALSGVLNSMHDTAKNAIAAIR
jgi:hypothetical protein